MDYIFDWLSVPAVIVLAFGSSLLGTIVMLRSARKAADAFRNFRGGGRGGGPHPLPATGAVESSRGSANPKE